MVWGANSSLKNDTMSSCLSLYFMPVLPLHTYWVRSSLPPHHHWGYTHFLKHSAWWKAVVWTSTCSEQFICTYHVFSLKNYPNSITFVMPYGFQFSFLPSLTLSVLGYKLSSRGLLKCLDAIQESSPITLLLHFSSLSLCPCDKHCIDPGKRSEDKHSLVLLRNFTRYTKE